MQELVLKGLNIIWGVWRYRWSALLVAWLIALVGWAGVHKIDHKYYASARIYVDTNEVLEPLLRGLAIQSDVKTRVALMSRTLLSRPNLEHLVDATDLKQTVVNSLDREKLLNDLLRDIVIRDATGSRSLYIISYAHTNSQIAKDVVSKLIDVFVNQNLGQAQEDNEAAQTFLDDQIVEYEQRLIAAEKRLSDFKRQNAGSMPSEAGGYYQRMQMAQTQLAQASLTLREAVQRRDSVRRQINSDQPVRVSNDPGTVSRDISRLASLQNQLDALLVRFTDRHPQVAQLRESIADLEKVVARNSSDQRPVRENNATSLVVNQQLRSMLVESEARVAELRVRVAQYQDELDDLKATVDSIPQVEAQLAQLDRDYATVRQQHETLLGRRESARLTDAVKENSDNVKFQVVDPPFVESRPAVPNKKVLNVGVFAASIAAGTGIAFLCSLLFPVFYDNRSLSTVTGLPVYGTVVMNQTSMGRARKWLGTAMFIALVLLLALALLGLLLVEIKGIDFRQYLGSEEAQILLDIYNKSMDLPVFEAVRAILENLI